MSNTDINKNNKYLFGEDVVRVVAKLNQEWLDTTEHLPYHITTPFEVVDNGFDIMVKLFGERIWADFAESRPCNEDTDEYMEMEQYLMEELDKVGICCKMMVNNLNESK